MTDSKLIGRYVKWNIDAPVSMPNGEVVSMQGKYTKILKIEGDSCYEVEIWGIMIYDRIDNGEVTLMPEGFDPNAKIVETKSEYVPKGTKFEESWIGRQFECYNMMGVDCSSPHVCTILSQSSFKKIYSDSSRNSEEFSWNGVIEVNDFKWVAPTETSKPPTTTKLLYKKGDILVSLASVTSGCREVGSLHLCNKDVTSAKAIHYTPFGGNETHSDKVDEFRLATPEETAFYHKGGRNIKDLVIDKGVEEKHAQLSDLEKGDILVSLKDVDLNTRLVGTLVKFVGFVGHRLSYTGLDGTTSNTDDLKTFREATPQEAELYHQGFKNIKDANSISGFVVGNWYTSSNWNKGSYAKFRKKEGRKFYYYESIFRETHRNKEDYWDLTKDVVLADMKEVSKYLPDGHPDKIVEPLNSVRDMIITEHEGVKVGEKLDVDVLNAWTKEGNEWSLREGFHKSRADFNKICELYVGTITLQGGQHIGHIKHTDYSFKIEGYKNFESDFQKKQVLSSLVPPQPKTTLSEVDYKIGDWLYVLDKFNSCLKIGDVGRICLIDRNGAMLLDVFRVESVAKWLNKNHVRKATTEEIERTLIAEARRRYPIGCTFKCPLITDGEALIFDQYYYDNMFIQGADYSVDCRNKGYLYHNGEWSPITSYPDKSIVPEKEQWTNFIDSQVKSQDADIAIKVHYKRFVYDGKDIIPSFDEEEYKQSSFNQLLQL